MLETILNIYLIIEKDFVVAFKAKAYDMEGSETTKIQFLKDCAKEDFNNSYSFEVPVNKWGKFMKYSKFAKLENQGMHFQLFENIFASFDVPQNPLICVTPVVDGEVLGE